MIVQLVPTLCGSKEKETALRSEDVRNLPKSMSIDCLVEIL